jgi:hypothetical protein
MPARSCAAASSPPRLCQRAHDNDVVVRRGAPSRAASASIAACRGGASRRGAASAAPAANHSVRGAPAGQTSGESSRRRSAASITPRSSQRPGNSIDCVKRPASNGRSDAGRPSAVTSQPIISAPSARSNRIVLVAAQPL